MIEIRYQTAIRCTAGAAFAAIVDLRGYDRWLASSKAYAGESTRAWQEPICPEPIGTRDQRHDDADPW